MIQWEYQVLSERDWQDLEKSLNKWGKLGWEAVGLTMTVNNEMNRTECRTILKRPIKVYVTLGKIDDSN